MPVGHVQRIDNERETVYIVDGGKTYAAPLSEVETQARVPSARVRFNLLRKQGVESAAEVRLRVGTRTNRRQRRFGDLTGATRPGAKVQTVASRDYGVDVTTQPLRIARAWLDALSAQDFDGATSLYLPEATVHTADASHVGHRRIRALLEQLALTGVDQGSIEIHGSDSYVRIECRAQTGEHVVYLTTESGSISEQWINLEPDDPGETDGGSQSESKPAPGSAPYSTSQSTSASTSQSISDSILIVRRGDVPVEAAEHATDRVVRLVEHSGRSLRSARIKLAVADNPSFDSPAMAEGSLEFDRLMVRAGARAQTLDEAIDSMARRLEVRIEHEHDRQNHQPTRMQPPPGTWRHGNLARPETPFYDRPVAEREVVRHKSFAPGEMTPDEATLDMALLDYDFFLFVEVDTGLDALLVQTEPGELVLHRLEGSAPTLVSSVNRIRPADTSTPDLTVSEAIELLDAGGHRLQFFANRKTGRGNVVYRRLDGHYGLITPSDEEV
ncbi:MAG: sigma 54 modulation/S30EA ribosomal C-terminal domain-containing protein [Acidimicrobiales bacterium]